MTYPIILAHGICPFDQIEAGYVAEDNIDGDDDRHYFRKIRSVLQDAGYTVWHTRVPWAGSVETRALALRAQIEKYLPGEGKFNIIAHSMGGLDARHMVWQSVVQKDLFHKRVASVTTIGTPHHGTSFADLLAETVLPKLEKLGPEAVRGLDLINLLAERSHAVSGLGLGVRFGLVGSPSFDLFKIFPQAEASGLGGARDLTRAACLRFNSTVRAVENDLYFGPHETQSNGKILMRTVAGKQFITFIYEPLKVPSLIIQAMEHQENDGLVPITSAVWDKRFFLGYLDADHLNEVGWGDDNEKHLLLGEGPDRMERKIRAFYLDLAQSLPIPND